MVATELDRLSSGKRVEPVSNLALDPEIRATGVARRVRVRANAPLLELRGAQLDEPLRVACRSERGSVVLRREEAVVGEGWLDDRHGDEVCGRAGVARCC